MSHFECVQLNIAFGTLKEFFIQDNTCNMLEESENHADYSKSNMSFENAFFDSNIANP